MITSAESPKVRTLGHADRPAAGQVDGGRWSTIEGRGEVLRDDESVRRAVDRYASRYRTPKPNPLRVAVRIEVERFLFSAGFAPTV